MLLKYLFFVFTNERDENIPNVEPVTDQILEDIDITEDMVKKEAQ